MNTQITGVLEIMPTGFGFLRSPQASYLASPKDIYLPIHQIQKFNLKHGDTISGEIEIKKDKPYLSKIITINHHSPESLKREPFEHLTPIFPNKKLNLNTSLSNRMIDLISPIGMGQRGLIVSQPKTGKTTILTDIANSISTNHPDIHLLVLLIDERPEEVTEMKRNIKGEVISSTFDEPADRHIKVANMTLNKAKRLVECGHNVVILLDSLTRLARAYNTTAPHSGKILTGGIDSMAMQKPKQFFGAARNIENGGH
jgi:transcription termination factor Rho